MEYEQDDQNNEGGFMQRIKESPRTVSALIIILIVAAAIYAFSGDQQQDTGTIATSEETTQQEEEAQPAEEAPAEEVAPTSTPAAEKTDQGYVEVAGAGDGLTHLARRATTAYLAENTVSYNVTNEHRIYIEDYIQNKLGTRGLALGETQTISFELIQEAIAAAGNLTPNQLNNLSQYTNALP